MEDTRIINKKPSIAAIEALKETINKGFDFYEAYNKAVKIFRDEGFTDSEFQDFARPYLRQRLSKDQIYYLFHIEDRKEVNKEQYEYRKSRINTTNDDKKDLEDSSNIEIKEIKPVIDIPLEESEYHTIIANLTIETEEANLDLPITVRVYYDGNIELEKFVCNQIKLI